MNKHPWSLAALLGAAVVAGVAAPARADELLLRRVQQEQGMHLPARGMSMAQVRRQFGPPLARLAPRGGSGPRQPVINRWRYPGYIVYFERDRVIHAVIDTPAGNNRRPDAVD
jgi:hypothetical protein